MDKPTDPAYLPANLPPASSVWSKTETLSGNSWLISKGNSIVYPNKLHRLNDQHKTLLFFYESAIIFFFGLIRWYKDAHHRHLLGRRALVTLLLTTALFKQLDSCVARLQTKLAQYNRVTHTHTKNTLLDVSIKFCIFLYLIKSTLDEPSAAQEPTLGLQTQVNYRARKSLNHFKTCKST